MRFGTRLTVVVVGCVFFWTTTAEAQTARRTAAPRSLAQTSRSTNGGFWNGQVRAFKQRWGLAPQTKPVARPGGAPKVQHAVYNRTARQQQVRAAAFQTHASSGQAMPGYPATSAVVAPSRPQPEDPATAGLVPGYPQFQGPLYPCPVPGIPDEIGGAMITNQAFAPHEMLYPHEYRALYPPFYYKVSGGWIVTPWGVWSSDRWELQGTEVNVKYKSYISPLTGFMPPTNVWCDEYARREKWY